MNPQQLLQLLWARRFLMAMTFGAVLLVTLALIIGLPRIYMAQVSLVADGRGVDPVSGAALPQQALDSIIATQVDIIRSHNVALRVVDALHLDQDPVLRQEFMRGPIGAPIRDWMADRIVTHVDAIPSRESSVIAIQVKDRNPQTAAERANAFATAYMQTELDLKLDPARRQAGWYQGQVQDLRTAVETAQQRLADFQRKSGLAGVDEKDSRLDVENARYAEISTQLVSAQASMADARSRLDQVDHARQHGQLNQLPDLVSDTTLQTLKTDLARAQASLADVAERYDVNAPPYRSALAQVDELKRKVAAELETATGSIRQQAEISEQRTRELQRTLDAQRTRIGQLQQARDTLSILTRDADNAQKTYDAATQRAGSVKLESRLDQSGVAILNWAVAPTRPARPRPLLYLLVGIILGALLAVGGAIAAEIFDRRVHGAADLEAMADAAVLAEIPSLLHLSPVPI
jgi:chain length determinant protein EpsF